MRKTIPVLILFLSTIGELHSQGQLSSFSSDTVSTAIDMFEETGPMDITLTFNIKAFQREKNKDEYRDVHFLYQFNDTSSIEHILRLKPRGQFRKSYCTYVPFWLNIRKANIVNENLQEVKRFKVVSQCRGGRDYSDLVLKEYLAYRIYNLLSPMSFRVRLVHMKYVDTGRKNKETESWAFLIEPEELMAERNGGIVIKNDEISMRFTRPAEMDLVALFQYMVGNPDYSIIGRQNMKLLGMPGFGAEGYTPVPYDFDYTGLVNAYYAIPNEKLGISSVRQRYYMGPCREDQEFQAAIDYIESKKEEIIGLVSDFKYLNDPQKKEMIAYLEDYFNSASNPNFIRSKLRSTCR